MTGWHVPVKKGKRAEPEYQPSGRGLVQASCGVFEPQPMPAVGSGPSKRRLRELDAPKKPKRAKPEQGSLL